MTVPASAQPGGPGHIITFYSYKGGTGRTMALANIAWILAANGHRVLVVDWDLESPGLHRFYHPLLADPQLHASDGVIDMVREFAALSIADPHRSDPAPIEVVADVRRFAVSLDWRFADGGELDLLPAGRQGAAYSANVSTFDWPSFYDQLNGATFLAHLRQNMRDHYDYILIDSRTGLSDSAGICTVLLPDTVVNCFTLSTQSIDGAAVVARSIGHQRPDDPVRILPVPMRVEEGEQSKLDAGRDYAWLRFARFLAHLDPEAMLRYWADVEIPYKLFYAYEEILAVFGDRARQPATLLAAYERLAGVVSGADLRHLPIVEESARRYWLAKFERTRPRAMTRVLIGYTAEDRMWAEWIAGILGAVGLATVLQDIAAAESEVPPECAADLTLVLVSANFHPHGTPDVLLTRASTPAPGRTRSGLLPVSLDGSTPPEQLERYGTLDLSGMSADRARAALLTALNWPTVDQATPEAERPAYPRFPGTQPRVSKLPRRNPAFTGRRRLLEIIRVRLTAHAGTGSPMVLAGLGGVGKTQVALEYAHRFAADYDVVWFVSPHRPA
jgi:cellulose biosynthesis protein BcsQ